MKELVIGIAEKALDELWELMDDADLCELVIVRNPATGGITLYFPKDKRSEGVGRVCVEQQEDEFAIKKITFH